MRILSILLLVLTLGSCQLFQRKPPEPLRFTVRTNLDHVELGEVEMQIDKRFPRSGLIKVVIKVSYYPEDDAVCLTYRSDFFTYQHFWDYEGRKLFVKSLETYRTDFASRNLHSNQRNTKSIYGVTEGFLTWQEFSFSLRHQANMNIEYGYFFRERYPYFSINQKQALYEDKIDRKNNTASQEVTMYFTIAQAQELVDLIDDAVLEIHSIPRIQRTPEINPDFY
ncbi:MAG: hypothetical protein FWD47_03840 [Treponema sp.]|nr:hypothetical protein [Treponema sp.]